MAGNYEETRVKYTNSALLSDVNAIVKRTAEEVFNDTPGLSADERQLSIERFEQCFLKAMSENLCYVGAAQNQDPIQPGTRLHYFCNEVLPNVDSVLVDVTRKRKEYPAKCKQLLENKLVSEIATYETGDANESKRTVEETSDPLDNELIGLASTVATNLSKFSQMSEQLMKKAESLKTAHR